MNDEDGMVMLNLHVRAPLGRLLSPVGERLARSGVSPDVVTIVGTIGVAGGALGFFTRGVFFLGTVVVTVFVFSDLLDGALARARGDAGPWGAFLDSTMDRVGDGAVFGSLVFYYAGRGHSLPLAGAALATLVGGFVTSYAKARAESLGLSCNVGFAERAERLIIVLVAAGLYGLGVPYLLPAALWFLAGATAFTVAQRLVEVHRQALGDGRHA
ncbi:MAG: phosphatidylinositol phosphate synthase [Mycobacteriales bacterium]